MRRSFYYIILFVLVIFISCFHRIITKDSIKDSETIHILFLGNSLMYFNDMPFMLDNLSERAGARPFLQVSHIGIPGGTLEMLYELPAVQRALHEKSWDYVVIQENPGFTSVSPNIFYENARRIEPLIDATGAETVYFLTWGFKGDSLQQEHLTTAYRAISNELSGIIAPVGPAFIKGQREHPEIELYLEDGIHPEKAGSYLAACVFYGLFYGESPAGLPASYTVNNITRTIGTLEEAAILQRIAWEMLSEF